MVTDTFNKRRTEIALWCKKAANENLYQPTFSEQSTSPTWGDRAKGVALTGLQIATHPAVQIGTETLETRHAYNRINSARKLGQQVQGAWKGSKAVAGGAAKIGPWLAITGTVMEAGAAGYGQYKMNQGAKQQGGWDTYKKTEQYQQDRAARNASLQNLGMIGTGAAIGASIGAFGGPLAPVTMAGGALIGAGIGSTVGVAKDLGMMAHNKWKSHTQGLDSDQALDAEYLATGNQGNDALGYTAALLNRKTSDYMKAGTQGVTNNAKHVGSYASSYTNANKLGK